MTVVSWYMYPTRTINIHINPSYISSSSQLSYLIHLLYLLSPINPHSYLKIILNPPSIFLKVGKKISFRTFLFGVPPRICLALKSYQADTGIQRKGCRAFANLGEFQVSREAIRREGGAGGESGGERPLKAVGMGNGWGVQLEMVSYNML